MSQGSSESYGSSFFSNSAFFDFSVSDNREYSPYKLLDSVTLSRSTGTSSAPKLDANDNDAFVEGVCNDFMLAVQVPDLEYGFDSVVDRIIFDVQRENPKLFLNVFTKLSRLNFDSPKRYAALLKAAGSIPYTPNLDDLFIPIAAAAAHDDKYVQEAMLHLFESWQAKESLRILSNITLANARLERYKTKVVRLIESMD